MKDELTEAQWLQGEIPVEQLAELTGCSAVFLCEPVDHGALAPNETPLHALDVRLSLHPGL